MADCGKRGMVAGDGGKLPSQAAYVRLVTGPLGPNWRHGLGPTWFVGGGVINLSDLRRRVVLGDITGQGLVAGGRMGSRE